MEDYNDFRFLLFRVLGVPRENEAKDELSRCFECFETEHEIGISHDELSRCFANVSGYLRRGDRVPHNLITDMRNKVSVFGTCQGWAPDVVEFVELPLSELRERREFIWRETGLALAETMSRFRMVSGQAQSCHAEGSTSAGGVVRRINSGQEGGDAWGNHSTFAGGSGREEVDALGTSFGGLDPRLPLNLDHNRADSPGSISHGGSVNQLTINSTHDGAQVGVDQPSTYPAYICIDIGNAADNAVDAEQILHQQWESYITGRRDGPVGSRVVSDPTTMQIVAQVAGAALSSSFVGSSEAKHVVYATTLVGFGLTFAGIGTRRSVPRFASAMDKIGAIASASAVIAGLAMALPATIAWPAGIVAGLGVAASVAFA